MVVEGWVSCLFVVVNESINTASWTVDKVNSAFKQGTVHFGVLTYDKHSVIQLLSLPVNINIYY